MEIRTAGGLGAGTMGNGIAHVFARSGYQVVLVETSQPALDRALKTISKNLDREVAKEKISPQERDAALQRIQVSLQREVLADCDFVIEAAFEKLEVKQEIFR